MTLAELLEAATPGPWEAVDGTSYLAGRGWWVRGPSSLSHDDDMAEADARLIALAPDIARLALDMGEKLLFIREVYGHLMSNDELHELNDLVARLDGIAGKEGA